ncbi:MAG TPA: glycerate kinase [Armatimonadota bacterium]|jgi:glycerate kinase
MRILIAPDSFKGSLSAAQVAAAMADGCRRACPEVEVDLCPMADGGEGTLEAYLTAVGGEARLAWVTGPLGTPVEAHYGVLADGLTVVLESAMACGLPLVPEDRRDPCLTTTYGLGELLLAAVEAGAARVVLGIGGSATNDGGAGMLRALGARLLDEGGGDLPPGGAALARLARIDRIGWRWPNPGPEVVAAADVTNPLCGPEGASAVFGPQKGATPLMVEELDGALARWAEVCALELGRDWSQAPGAGAAGGLGFALMAFLGARLVPGVRLLREVAGLDARAARADLVITGEGRLDAQTAYGKTIAGVCEAARGAGTPVVALCGSIKSDSAELRGLGLAAALSIAAGPASLNCMVQDAAILLARAAEEATRLLLLGRRSSG